MRKPTGGVMSIAAAPALSGVADLADATNERKRKPPGKMQRASSLVGFMKCCNDDGAAKSFKHIFPRHAWNYGTHPSSGRCVPAAHFAKYARLRKATSSNRIPQHSNEQTKSD